MPKTTKQSKAKTSVINWDLSNLYQGINDPQITKDLQSAQRKAATFTKRFTGQIASKKVTSDTVLKAIKAYENIVNGAIKPLLLAYLINAVESEKPEHGAFLQKMQEQYTALRQQLLWFDLELASLDNLKVATRLLKDPKLAKYRHFIEKQLVFHPHRLSETEEKLMSDKSLTGRGAWERLFEQETSTLSFEVKIKGKKLKLTEAELLARFNTEPDQANRQELADLFTKGLQAKLSLFTYISNMLAQDQAIDTRLRKFDTPEHARHLENDTTQASVDTLSQVVTDHYHLSQEYYQLKRKVMGLQKMYDYDRYAPIRPTQTKFTWSEAQQLVLTAFNEFSPQYGLIAQEFFDHNWIHATPKPGKQGGAFCMYITPDRNPYILLNFDGSITSVTTLAHELGHGIHARLASKQPLMNFDWPITLAETASVFGEMLVFDYLNNQLTDPKERLSLYMGHIDRIIATVFRQISMYRFEQAFHKARREQGELSSEAINKLWRQTQEPMFGKSVTLTRNYDVWWSYIPHFIRSPFYVYAYAFGELLTLALYARYKEQGAAFAPHLIDILRAGGSQSPQELLKPHGIDLESQEFWEQGMAMIADTLAHAKQLAK